MVSLIYFLAFIYPWTVLSFYLYDRLVYPGQIVSSLIAVLGIGLAILGRYRVHGLRDKWMVPFVLFLAVGCFSIAISPYQNEILGKGVIQVVGIVTALVCSVVVIREIERTPQLLLKVVRVLSMSLGVLGWIAIGQFLVFNTIGLDSLFDFSFLNSVMGYPVWRYPGEIGGLHRANSLAAEPAHLARYLLCASGIALLRFGMLGGGLRTAARPAMPMWSAIGVIGGALATLSLLAYIGLVIVAGACWLLSHRLKARLLVGAAISIAMTLGVIAGLTYYAGEEFIEKAASVTLIASVGVEQGALSGGIGTGELSALAVASNVAVMVDNLPRHPLLGVGLGGHPASYERYAPPYARYSEDLEGLNAQDAASLLVRLLSETGIIGTALFLLAGFGLLISCRRAILGSPLMAKPVENTSVSSQALSWNVIVVAIGIGAGWTGVFVQYLMRAGQYYEQAMWIPIALVAVTPYLIRRAEWSEESS
jgi:hypothetical protein